MDAARGGRSVSRVMASQVHRKCDSTSHVANAATDSRSLRPYRTERVVGIALLALHAVMSLAQDDVHMQEQPQPAMDGARGDAERLTTAQVMKVRPTPVELVASVMMYSGPMTTLGVVAGACEVAPISEHASGIGGVLEPGAGGPIRARKSKRMDRRLTHWQCVYCRHETRNDAKASACGKCGGTKSLLGDADATGRDAARRQARSKEYVGRQLNVRGAGTDTVPRAAQGVFERARWEALVRWETDQLEQYTGAPSYLKREEYTLGVMESFYIVHTGARVSVLDEAKRALLTEADVASF